MKLPRDMRAFVSRVNDGDRKIPRAMAGSVWFDTNKISVNQAFVGFFDAKSRVESVCFNDEKSGDGCFKNVSSTYCPSGGSRCEGARMKMKNCCAGLGWIARFHLFYLLRREWSG
ncbi:hypothetical protein [Burkholderia sp. GbtcB21]|uniref:hypothetical protein n=2 Tax=Burkholderiaceae TaxID=119060 RepID=UPI001C3029CD|nr:hypothetical protein [Burkholderia sp. GbtcB21]